MKFELRGLPAYDDEAPLAEIRRVAALEPSGPLTRERFQHHAKVHVSTIGRRFGGWQRALIAAGLADQYSGQPVSASMRHQARGLSADELAVELRRIADRLGTDTLTVEQFRSAPRTFSVAMVRRGFGSWSKAIAAAGLKLSPHGHRWTEDDYFENLLEVWTFHGRQPARREMNEAPSRISAGGYAHRFGTWRKALLAFVERVDADDIDSNDTEPAVTDSTLPVERVQRTLPHRPRGPRAEDSRHIPIGLRYNVLSRDHFRCVLCGRSPATHHGLVLHVDHVIPMARGGKTRIDNLRPLCQDCNIGKASKVE